MKKVENKVLNGKKYRGCRTASKPKILFIYCMQPYGREFFSGKLPPLGLEYIAAYIGDKADIKIVDLRFRSDLERIVREYKPEIIGINIKNCVRSSDAYQVARKCRTLSNALLVAGGIHATTCPNEVLANSFNVVVRGEGEKTMGEIAVGKPLKDILGISYKNGKIIHNPDRTLVDLDNLPLPARHLRDPKANYSIFSGKIKADIISTSRGCVGDCPFCSPAVYYRGRRRQHSVEYVIGDLKRIDRNCRFILLSDDDFATDLRRVEEICEKIIKEGIEKNFHVQLRMLPGHKKLKKLMVKAGFKYVTFGVETAFQERIKDYKKSINLKLVKECIKEWYDVGAKFVNTSFVFGDPRDDERSLLAMGDFAREIDSSFADLIWLTPYPGTPLREEFEKNKLILTNDWRKYTQGIQLVKHPSINEERMQELRQEAWFRFFSPRKWGRFLIFGAWITKSFSFPRFSLDVILSMLNYRNVIFGDIYESESIDRRKAFMKYLRSLGSFSPYERNLTKGVNQAIKELNLRLPYILNNRTFQTSILDNKKTLSNLILEFRNGKAKRCLVTLKKEKNSGIQFYIQAGDIADLLLSEPKKSNAIQFFNFAINLTKILAKNVLQRSLVYYKLRSLQNKLGVRS